jgi:pyruvate,orthophosphate dikinase
MRDPVVRLDGRERLDARLAGRKAVGINRMRQLGLAVPPAFVISAAEARSWRDGRTRANVWSTVVDSIQWIEHETGTAFGNPACPLLLSVRSGAYESMPGMMDTVLNVGSSQPERNSAAVSDGAQEWARDTWARFTRSWTRLASDPPLPPPDAYHQLRVAIQVVASSWDRPRAAAYRERLGIVDGLGTAVTVQSMVFGNRDDRSGTGVAMSHDPISGERVLSGEWLRTAQGDDLVSGLCTPRPLADLASELPDAYRELARGLQALESDMGDVVCVEFTVESGKLYFLQMHMARSGPRDPSGTRPNAFESTTVITGVGASPGTASGYAHTVIEEALRDVNREQPVVLVRPFTAPDDVPAMFLAAAVVTAYGGLTSHAAVICRELGIPCVVGCGTEALVRAPGRHVTVDGSRGVVTTSRSQDTA